jgi:phosphoenolpyruvate-protein kinase (PTS system EI component)
VSEEELAVARALPARTLDGVEVALLANVASTVEARRALQAGAAGVGLLRTELAHLAATRWPSRAEHERSLRPVLDALAGRPVAVRLLDFTNDKKPPFLATYAGPPSLALLLADPDALDAQLSAVLSAGSSVDLRVLVPMVERAEDLVAVRSRLATVAGAVGVDVPPLGAMLETPAAIDALPSLLDVADFFSLGTNDLTAATLRRSRTDQQVGPAQAAHPAVLRQVERAARLTAPAGLPLSVCGDAAADPAVLPLLLGAGLRTLSVAPSRLDAVRALVRSADVAACRARLADVLAGAPATGLVSAGVSDV